MANRLADETSPYLLQHAHNPVDWYPWGPEALERARAEDRPILLSVGYSACHWCHVMERESFENAEIAAQMNRDFVNIKVDREERPDLDEIYMRAVQALNRGQGGWPMTVFLTPEGKPFWGGTYFPPEPRGGMPGFGQVLGEMARLYRDHRDQVGRITGEMVDYLDRTSQMPPPQRSLRGDWLDRVAEGAAEVYDADNGGFGTAPKFPAHGLLPCLLAHWGVSGSERSLRMATHSLDAMARGGVYDLLAGGFARYSVDPSWRVPHFEKMLYDNGQLLPVYLDAWKATGAPHYARVVRQTAGWLIREMRLDHGGFAASTDADSEGVEGRYFAWTPDELTEVLGADGPRAAELLAVSPEGSFEHGTSVLRLEHPLEQLDLSDWELLERSLPKLLAARGERVAPGRDDKVVVAWNGLVIGALARCGAAMGEPEWVRAACEAAQMVLSEVRVEGRLMRTYKDGRAHVLGCADDHATLLAALLDLWEATFDQRWLVEANELANQLVALFWDEDGGGLFFTGSDAPPLVTRSKNLAGGAEPSANGVAALAFVRLARLCGREDLGERAAVILGGLQPTLIQVPRALGVEAIAGHWWTNGGLEIALAGELSTGSGAELLAEVRRRYLPTAVVAARRRDEPYTLLPWLLGKTAKQGPTAFLCQGHSCKLPTEDPAELGRQLDEALKPTVERTPLRVHAPALPADPELWLNAAEPLTLERLAGNVVVLDFWTYCCVNCMHVLPALAEVERRFAGQPVAVVGVHAAKFDAEKERANVQAAIERYGVRHPVVLDGQHRVWSEYAVRSWPTVVLLDPTGRIAWDQSGEVSAEVLLDRVQGLLDEGAERGTLGAAAWEVSERAQPETGGLRFPGKLSVWSAAEGDDPWAGEVRLYLSDSGGGRVVELALERGADGWPVATELRSFAGFRDPQGSARWGDRLYVADAGSHQLKCVDLNTGEVAVLAGTGELGRGGTIDPADPLQMALRSPWDVCVSGEGEEHVAFVAMAGTHQLWVWLPAEGRFGPFAGSGREDHVDGSFEEAALAQPSGLAMHGPYLFFADSEVSSIRALDLAERQVVTVVGKGLFDFGDVDGVGSEVLLQHPLDVAAVGNTVYVADSYNHKIKAIDLHGGASHTLVGAGELWEPGGLDLLGDYLVIADTNHHRVVVVDRESGELRALV